MRFDHGCVRTGQDKYFAGNRLGRTHTGPLWALPGMKKTWWRCSLWPSGNRKP